MPSPALIAFGQRMSEVRRLLEMCSTSEQTETKARPTQEVLQRDRAVLRGALVLLCSHVEGFFEDVVSDAVNVYDRIVSKFEDIPSEITIRQVLGSPRLWELTDTVKRWKAVKKWSAHPLVKDTPSIPPRCFDAELHTVGFANPGTGEIESLLGTIGIKDVWTRFASIEPTRLIFTSAIDTIVNRRNQIAHGDFGSTVTLDDVRTYVSRAERVAEVIDQIVTLDINSRLSLMDCWKSLDEQINGISSPLPDASNPPLQSQPLPDQ